MSKTSFIIVGTLLFCLVASIIIAVVTGSRPAPPPPPSNFNPYWAAAECEAAVRELLVSPSSMVIIDEEVFRVTGRSDDWHYVQGQIDSANRMNAMIRSEFSCVLERIDEDNWIVHEVSIK